MCRRLLRIGAVSNLDSKASRTCWSAKAQEEQRRVQGFLLLLSAKAPKDRRHVQGFLLLLVCAGSWGSAPCPRLLAPDSAAKGHVLVTQILNKSYLRCGLIPLWRGPSLGPPYRLTLYTSPHYTVLLSSGRLVMLERPPNNRSRVPGVWLELVFSSDLLSYVRLIAPNTRTEECCGVMTAMASHTQLHCTALLCTALHCTALHCTALHCTALHCTALHCTALHCTTLHCTALHLTLEQSCHGLIRWHCARGEVSWEGLVSTTLGENINSTRVAELNMGSSTGS